LGFTEFVCEHKVKRRKLLGGDFHNLYSPNDDSDDDDIINNKTAVTLKYIFGTPSMN